MAKSGESLEFAISVKVRTLNKSQALFAITSWDHT